MIDLIEVEKERLLDEVSFPGVLVYWQLLTESLPCAGAATNHPFSSHSAGILISMTWTAFTSQILRI